MARTCKFLSDEELLLPLKSDSSSLADSLRELATSDFYGLLIAEAEHACNTVSVEAQRILKKGTHSVFKRIHPDSGRIFSLVVKR